MEITYIKLKRLNSETRLKALADVTLDDLIVIHDIKILENANGGLFFGMPSRKRPDNTFSDIVHPITREARGVFEGLLIPAAEKLIDEDLSQLHLKKETDLKTNNTLFDQTLDDFVIVEDFGRPQDLNDEVDVVEETADIPEE